MHSEIVPRIVGILVGAILGYGFGVWRTAGWSRKSSDVASIAKRSWFGPDACLFGALGVLILITLVGPLLAGGGLEWWAVGGLIAGYALRLLFRAA